MNKNETAAVGAIILNSTPDNLSYSVHFEAPGFMIRSPDQNITVTIPTSQTAQVTWMVTAVEPGDREITVEALSSQDLKAVDIPPEYRWKTSFREACGVAVINSPLTSKQIMLLSLTSMFVGAVLLLAWFDLKIWGRIARRKQPLALAAPQTPAKAEVLKAVAFYGFQIVLIAVGSIVFGLDYLLRHGAGTTTDNQCVLTGSPVIFLSLYAALLFVWLDPKMRERISVRKQPMGLGVTKTPANSEALKAIASYLLQIVLLAVGASLFLFFLLGEIGISLKILSGY